MGKIKNLFPISKKQFDRLILEKREEFENLQILLVDLQQQNEKLFKHVIELEESILNRVEKNQGLSDYSLNRLKKIQEIDEFSLKRLKKIQEIDTSCLKELKTIRNQQPIINRIKNAANESIWSDVFHDTILESKWLHNKKFSPGRWAVGYQYLYVLYRILDEIKPENILELGLGQSTQMISQYVEHQKGNHIVVEHDPDWLKFYGMTNYISEHTTILQLPLISSKYKNQYAVITYEEFEVQLKDKVFDLLSIDAPFGGSDNEYSRIDILNILPECLSENFVILIDDYNRLGEKNMVVEIENILKNNEIPYFTGIYSGNKDTYLIASEKWKFLCSL